MPQLQTSPERPNPQVTAMIAETRDLLSPPPVHFALLEVLNDPEATAGDIAEVIAMDASLTARLLRIVNSPWYGMSGRIDTITRAVTVVGTSDLFALAAAVSATTIFSRISSALISMETFWRHSVYTALLARALASTCRILHPERLFVAGLLHDVGSLLLFNERTDAMADLLLAAQGDEEVLCQLEKQRLGFNHAEVGAAMLANWQLPEGLHEAVRHHHAPYDQPYPGVESAIVHVADYMANRSERGSLFPKPTAGPGLDEAVLRQLDLTPRALAKATAIADDGFDETIAIFLG